MSSHFLQTLALVASFSVLVSALPHGEPAQDRVSDHFGSRYYNGLEIDELKQLYDMILQEQEEQALFNRFGVGGYARNLGGIGGSTLVNGRNVNGLGGSSLVGRANGLGGNTLLGRMVNGRIGGNTLLGRETNGYNLQTRNLDSLGGANLVRNLDSLGGANLVRNLDALGGANLVRNVHEE